MCTRNVSILVFRRGYISDGFKFTLVLYSYIIYENANGDCIMSSKWRDSIVKTSHLLFIFYPFSFFSTTSFLSYSLTRGHCIFRVDLHHRCDCHFGLYRLCRLYIGLSFRYDRAKPWMFRQTVSNGLFGSQARSTFVFPVLSCSHLSSS